MLTEVRHRDPARRRTQADTRRPGGPERQPTELDVPGVGVTLVDHGRDSLTRQSRVLAGDAVATLLEDLRLTVSEGPGLSARGVWWRGGCSLCRRQVVGRNCQILAIAAIDVGAR